MSIFLQIISLLLCLQIVRPLPIQDEESSLQDVRVAKRLFYPYRHAILSPFGFLDTPRGQRKKAVDSTFIRFGRSSSSEFGNERMMDNPPSPLMVLEDSPEVPHQGDTSSELSVGLPQRFHLYHNGCRVSNIQELRKALLEDPNCIRVFQKSKKGKVNDTFIRFGKRELPSEKEFESSSEAR